MQPQAKRYVLKRQELEINSMAGELEYEILEDMEVVAVEDHLILDVLKEED